MYIFAKKSLIHSPPGWADFGKAVDFLNQIFRDTEKVNKSGSRSAWQNLICDFLKFQSDASTLNVK